MTPYTWRNFVTGASTAREGQMGRFFLQKRHFIHKLSVKKQETGQKTGKNPPKKGVFISPSDQLAEFGLKSCQLFEPRRQKLPTFEAWPQKLDTFQAKLGELVRGADKNTFFWRVFARFCPVFCFFTDSLYVTRIF